MKTKVEKRTQRGTFHVLLVSIVVLVIATTVLVWLLGNFNFLAEAKELRARVDAAIITVFALLAKEMTSQYFGPILQDWLEKRDLLAKLEELRLRVDAGTFASLKSDLQLLQRAHSFTELEPTTNEEFLAHCALLTSAIESKHIEMYKSFGPHQISLLEIIVTIQRELRK